MTALRGRSISIAGTLAYVSDGSAGWKIVSLTNPLAPQIVYNSGALTSRIPSRFVGQGSYLFVSSTLTDIMRFQIQVYDVSNPAYPVVVGETAMTDVPFGSIAPGATYLYVAGMSGVTIYDCSGVLSTPDNPRSDGLPVPATLRLIGCYPNPFNPSTTVAFDLPAPSRVRLAVYDVTGREVAVLADGPHAAGHYATKFDGTALATGTYFCRLSAGNQTQFTKLLLLK